MYQMKELDDPELTYTEKQILNYLVKKRDSFMESAKEEGKLQARYRYCTCILNTIISDVNYIIEESRY